jgi:hypothetical protein
VSVSTRGIANVYLRFRVYTRIQQVYVQRGGAHGTAPAEETLELAFPQD